jgi:hypothetical protein
MGQTRRPDIVRAQKGTAAAPRKLVVSTPRERQWQESYALMAKEPNVKIVVDMPIATGPTFEYAIQYEPVVWDDTPMSVPTLSPPPSPDIVDEFVRNVTMPRHFEILRATCPCCFLQLVAAFPNTYDPTRTTMLQWSIRKPTEPLTLEVIGNAVMDAIMVIQEHEIAEQLKLYGSPMFDPHIGGALRSLQQPRTFGGRYRREPRYHELNVPHGRAG